jgi:glycine betaine/proline transport system permease protein
MSYASIPMTRPASLTLNRWVVFWGVMILVTVLLMLSKESLPWAFKYPRAWQIPLAGWITGFMKWLINSFDLGLFTFKEFTRWIALLVEQPYTLVKSLLSTGFLSGVGSDAVQVFPRISWVALVAGVMLFGHYVRDWKLALLVGGCFGYLVVFGQWDSAMVTLSSIIIAVPVGVVGGVLLGIFGHRSHRFRMVLVPILDLMQTVPVFAYLVPVLLLFGFSPVSAMIATIIYAMPPMVRVTLLALEHITTEIVEAGSMAGCDGRGQPGGHAVVKYGYHRLDDRRRRTRPRCADRTQTPQNRRGRRGRCGDYAARDRARSPEPGLRQSPAATAQ